MNKFIAAGDVEAVRRLCDQEPREINRTHACSIKGYTPLIAACRFNQPAMVRILLEHGADPTVKDLLGRTAGDWAVAYGYDEIIGLLPIQLTTPKLIEGDDEDGPNLSPTGSGSQLSILDHPSTLQLLLTFPERLEFQSAEAAQKDYELARHVSLTNEARARAELEPELAVPVPTLRIAILVVGTYGDISPFCALGKRLLQDGHRVRLASHAEYRGKVMAEGLEFYPLAGDPKELSEFMVKTGGKLLPESLNEVMVDVPRKMQVMREIIFSTWDACTAPDPEGGPGGEGEGAPFVADAIISNPPAFGHIHVAEALSCPLHLMFPQPWVPTRMYPHPLACIDRRRSILPYTTTWSLANYHSYQLVDEMMWTGMANIFNDFRRELHLGELRRGDNPANIVTGQRVPFAHMWSPSLVPKPPDWGPQVDVVGAFFDGPLESVQYTPDPNLQAYLDSGPPPILITFGSMKFDDPHEVTSIIYSAARETTTRVLIQSGWTEMGIPGAPIPDGIFIMGRAPHDWLMSRSSAVIHHGGAGTTAAGLRCGKPTFICPFFGDQHFWGSMVERAGVGPPPCLIKELTHDILVDKILALQRPEVVEKAKRLAKDMEGEDGVEGGVQAFYRNLPRSRLACGVCVRLGQLPPRVAKFRTNSKPRVYLCTVCNGCVDKATHSKDVKYKGVKYKGGVFKCVKWGVAGPGSCIGGVASGTAYITDQTMMGVKEFFVLPVHGFQDKGVAGGVFGFGRGVYQLSKRCTKGSLVFVDKLATGAVNQFREEDTQDLVSSRLRSLAKGERMEKMALKQTSSADEVVLTAEEEGIVVNTFIAMMDQLKAERRGGSATRPHSGSSSSASETSCGRACSAPG